MKNHYRFNAAKIAIISETAKGKGLNIIKKKTLSEVKMVTIA